MDMNHHAMAVAVPERLPHDDADGAETSGAEIKEDSFEAAPINYPVFSFRPSCHSPPPSGRDYFAPCHSPRSSASGDSDMVDASDLPATRGAPSLESIDAELRAAPQPAAFDELDAEDECMDDDVGMPLAAELYPVFDPFVAIKEHIARRQLLIDLVRELSPCRFSVPEPAREPGQPHIRKPRGVHKLELEASPEICIVLRIIVRS